jgi:hypothetical protein
MISRIRHRFPCACGVEHLVVPSDAGQQIHCSCGKILEVPTLRRLRQLPTSDSDRGDSSGTRRPWSTRQGLLFNVGLVVLVLALFALVFLGRKRSQLSLERPAFPYQEFVAKEVAQWNVNELWQFWTANREVKLDARPTPDYLIARQVARRLDGLLAVAAGFGVVGLVAVCAAVLYRPRLR